MPCKHTRGLQRYLLDDPAGAEGGVWAAHLRHCEACRSEYAADRRALAVFTQLEQERRSERLSAPSWQRLAHRLEAESRLVRRQALVRRLSGVAAVLAVFVGGLSALQYLREPPQPAHIIQLHPEQRQRLERVLQRSLGDPLPEMQRSLTSQGGVQPAGLEQAEQPLRVADESASRARVTHPWRQREPVDAGGMPPQLTPLLIPVGGPDVSELVHVRNSPVRRYLLR